MVTITKNIGFSGEYSSDIDSVVLEFSDEDLQQIKNHQKYLEDNPTAFKVSMLFNGEHFLDGEESDLRTDTGELFIFKDCVYYNVCGKYDSTDIYETHAITNEELFGA